MAFKYADRIKETTSTTGTGNMTLLGAVTGFRAFSSELSDGDTFFYAIEAQSGGDWEVGLGTFVAATPAIARTLVLESSNAGAAVNFGSGTKDVWIDFPAVAAKGVEPSVNDFRLTLTSATPVTTSDVSTATTLYATPYKGKKIALHNGNFWEELVSNEFSLALGTLTSGKNYDVFCYNNAGSPALEFLAWTSDSARATALAYQDGILVKSGDATRRYLGSFRTISTTQTCDTERQRLLWNYYHRVNKPVKVRESTANWTYNTATPRYANGNSNNRVEVLVGVVEDTVAIHLRQCVAGSGTQNVIGGIGINVSNSVNNNGWNMSLTAGKYTVANDAYTGFPALGFNFFAWIESSEASATVTWYSAVTIAGGDVDYGMNGLVRC